LEKDRKEQRDKVKEFESPGAWDFKYLRKEDTVGK
jgi:hypothetical protein